MAIINDNTLALAVEGYPGRLSYQPGEEVALHCSARTKHFSVEIARVGAEREVVWRRATIPGTEQPTPPMAYATGCGWPVTLTVPIPPTWRSGFYTVTLRGAGVAGTDRRVILTVMPAKAGIQCFRYVGKSHRVPACAGTVW